MIQTLSDKLITLPVVKPLTSTLTHRIFNYLFHDQDLDFLNDQLVCIHCSTMDLAICYTRQHRKMVLLPAKNWHVKISISLQAVLSLISDETDADTLFFNRELKIEGDTALGLACKNMLDSIDRSQLPAALFTIVKFMNKTFSPSSAKRPSTI